MVEPQRLPRLVALKSPHGHWEARAEGAPETAATGGGPDQALLRLVKLLGLRCTCKVVDEAPERVVYVRLPESFPCHECRGIGWYAGLNVVEDCGRCGGTGKLPYWPPGFTPPKPGGVVRVFGAFPSMSSSSRRRRP